MTNVTAKTSWIRVASSGELIAGEMRTVKRAEHQLVVGRNADGAPFALDNRCPHEGYPLASGDLEGCELTCCWHNWKFDTRDGACLMGGEAVRRYPVRERDGEVEVDLADPPPEERWSALRASLEEGMLRYENGRALRDAARLLQAGYAPERIAADVAAWDARHAEYGSTHALAVSADVGRLFDRYTGTEALYALAPAIDIAGESNRRLPVRPLAQPLPIDPDTAGEDLRHAVEAEDSARAEGLLLGAFDAGVDRSAIESWLYAVASDHFLDFGHPLIYLVKSQELLERLGDGARNHAREIHAGQLFGIAMGTREDTLPYMRGYFERLDASKLPELWERADGSHVFDAGLVRDAVLDGSPGEAFDAVWKPLERGASPLELARTLVGAAAHRLLRFDDAVDRDEGVAENWVWVTHRFTFASAARNALQRFRSPDALRFLVQTVAFVNSARRLDLPVGERFSLEPEEASAQDVLDAVLARDARTAVRRTIGFLRSGRPLDELRLPVEDLLLSDPLVRPISVAHAIKTPVAAFEEYGALEGHPDRELVLAASIRLLASPLVERRVHQAAATSLRWVVDGEMPRKLTQ